MSAAFFLSCVFCNVAFACCTVAGSAVLGWIADWVVSGWMVGGCMVAGWMFGDWEVAGRAAPRLDSLGSIFVASTFTDSSHFAIFDFTVPRAVGSICTGFELGACGSSSLDLVSSRFAGSGSGSTGPGSGSAGSGFAGSGFADLEFSGFGFTGSGFAGPGFADTGFAGLDFAGLDLDRSGSTGISFAGSRSAGF